MEYAKIESPYYCGIDLHSRSMYVCIIDQKGKKLFHRNLENSKDGLREILEPYGSDIAVGVESTYNWYWVADTCAEMNTLFYLGHALYMRAIQVDKFKDDERDSQKIADLMRAGLFPKAYVYPKEMRATRDLLRRRQRYALMRGEGFTHLQQLFAQEGKIDPMRNAVRHKTNRWNLPDQLEGEDISVSARCDLDHIEAIDRIMLDLESQILKQARHHDPKILALLLTIPGVGKIIGLTILYETHQIERFPRPQNYASYCRLVPSKHSSSGKNVGGGNSKIGNAYLKNAFTEIISVSQRVSEPIKKTYERLKSKHGIMKARGIMARRFNTTVYYMLKNAKGFDVDQFVNT